MENNIQNTPNADCKTGSLPSRAPLAVPFVPFQDNNPPRYNSGDSLNRGTAFPGLDLPWKNTVNTSNPAEGTILGESMAADFKADDLQLFLDTHEDDREVFEVFRAQLREIEELRCKFVKQHGPLYREDSVNSEYFDWLKGPWPWEFNEGRM